MRFYQVGDDSMRVVLTFPRIGVEHYAPPLGISYIAAFLRESGVNVKIVDPNFLHSREEYWKSIDRAKPDILGISTLTPYADEMHALANHIKNNNTETCVIVGGPHATVMPQETISNKNIDFLVMGEGEITFLELVNALDTGNDTKQINGLVYRENGSIKITGPRAPIPDLDTLPFPARDLLPMDRYLQYSNAVKLCFPPITTVVASRGCPYNCSFCQPTLRKIFGSRVRYRSPKNVVDEVEYLISKYKLNGIGFTDDTFTANKRWLFEFCGELRERGVDISWYANSRVDTIDSEKLRIMKQAGCKSLEFGVESGSPQILNTLNKKITVEQTIRAFTLCKQNGVMTAANIMVGSPGETWESIGDTISLIRKIEPEFMMVSITQPLPGTNLFEYALEEGLLKFEGYSKLDRSHIGSLKLENLSSSDIGSAVKQIKQTYLSLHKSLKYSSNKFFRHYLFYLIYSLRYDPRFLLRVLNDIMKRLTL